MSREYARLEDFRDALNGRIHGLGKTVKMTREMASEGHSTMVLDGAGTVAHRLGERAPIDAPSHVLDLINRYVAEIEEADARQLDVIRALHEAKSYVNKMIEERDAPLARHRTSSARQTV